MRPLALLALAAAAACAQIPPQDARNSAEPDTNSHFEMPVYKTLAEWEARKAHLRRQVLSAAGLLPLPEKTPLHPQVFGRIERDGYSIEKVLLETLPGYYLGGNLYRPLGKPGRHAGIVSPHGHWLYGRLENQQLGSIPARGINLALQGHVVFTYDMVGYNDTIQTEHAFGGPREQLWSFGPLGLQLWNSIRAVDFLQSLPDVDPEKIGATGASGGGTQTFLLTAVDDRVKWSAPVNMISAIMQGGSPCENAPTLRVGAFNVEYGAMMAPRPLLMVSATGDWTHNTPREEFPAIQGIYKLYGKPGNVTTIQIDAPHNYNQHSREAVYRFFGKQILGDADAAHFAEKPVDPEKPNDMLALFNRTLPDNAIKYPQIVDQWARASMEQTRKADLESVRESLTYALAVEWPREVLSEVNGEHVLLGRPGRGDRVPAIWLRGSGAVAVVVHPDGAEAARNAPEVRELLRAGRSVLLLDTFQTGSAIAPKPAKTGLFHLTFHRSDDANRVQDILTALAFLHRPDITLLGLGKAAVWTLFAAAVTPQSLDFKSNVSAFRGADQEFIDQFFVPGIQRAGGLDAALRLTKR